MTYIGNSPAPSAARFKTGSATGNGTAGPYNMGFSAASADLVWAYVNGELVPPSDYSVDGVNITFGYSIYVGADLRFRGIQEVSHPFVPQGGSVGETELDVPALRNANILTQAAEGAPPLFTARAWVVFNGVTSTILSSANVSSILKNAVGDFTITFTEAMPDANYVVAGTATSLGAPLGYAFSVNPHTLTPASVRVITGYSTSSTHGQADRDYCSVVIYR